MQELTASLGIQGPSYEEHERLTTSLIKNTMEMKIFCREGAVFFTGFSFNCKIQMIGFTLLDFMQNHQIIFIAWLF